MKTIAAWVLWTAFVTSAVIVVIVVVEARRAHYHCACDACVVSCKDGR